jgi:ankyrin repeat protein
MAEISRAQIRRVKPNLLRLPLELFTMIMDYLDFPEILCLCEDPEFPIEHLQRRHLVDKNNNSILFYIISRNWLFDSATKTIIRILGDWDVPGGEDDLRPLNATIDRWGEYKLCKTFVEAGARLDLGETTYQSGKVLSEHVMGLTEKTRAKLLEIEPGTAYLNEMPLEPLHIAVLKNNNNIVGLLLRHGANPNSLAGVLGTSLHLTTDRRVTKTLLEHGADINAKNGLGYTPLVNAISKWKPDLVDLLVEAGADVQLSYDENVSALNLAIEMGSFQMVERLLDAKCDVNGHPGGVPPLHLSAKKGQDDILHFLIERGADLAIRHKDRTVLHVTRCPATIDKLLAYGADVNAKDKTGSTAFMLATKECSVPLMEIYLMAGAEVSPTHLRENDVLSWVVFHGLYKLLKMLISRCDIRRAVTEPKDLLLQAIRGRHEGIAFLLLEELPHLIAEGEDSIIDIMWAAVSRSSPRLVQKILDVMTNVEAEDAVFTESLISAIDVQRDEIVKLLPQALIKPIKLGQNVTLPLFVLAAGNITAWENIQDALEEHPTKWMSDYEQWWRMEENIEADLSILQTLIDHGVDIGRAEHSGIGILHVLAWRNDERLMSAFVAAGANPLFKDSEGNTPAYWAARMSHHKMEKMLRLAEAEAVAEQQKEEGSK